MIPLKKLWSEAEKIFGTLKKERNINLELLLDK